MSDPIRIAWKADGDGGFNGYAGPEGMRLFELWQSPCDADEIVIGEWVLHAELPVRPGRRKTPHGRDPDDLKAEAERWLAGFVSSLGAAFPEKRTCPDCYGGGTDGTVNRNDCPGCSGTGSVLRVPETGKG